MNRLSINNMVKVVQAYGVTMITLYEGLLRLLSIIKTNKYSVFCGGPRTAAAAVVVDCTSRGFMYDYTLLC